MNSHKKIFLPLILLCLVLVVLTASFILSNTYQKSSHEEINTSPQSVENNILPGNAELDIPGNERIGDVIPIYEIENVRIYRVYSEHTIDEAVITELLNKLQTRAGNYSEKAKILAENDCGTWYVKISIPNMDDEEIYNFICSNASLEFITGYGTESAEIIVDSSHILSATSSAYNDAFGCSEYAVDIVFTEEGSKLFADATTKHMGDTISIVYDGQVISAPTVTSPITDGRAVINGLNSLEEAQEIATFLNIGTLNVALEKVK